MYINNPVVLLSVPSIVTPDPDVLIDPVVGATIHLIPTLMFSDAAGRITVCDDALTNKNSLNDAVEAEPDTVRTVQYGGDNAYDAVTAQLDVPNNDPVIP